MLKAFYRHLPLPKDFKPWLKRKVPLSWQRQSCLRKFGSINELYFWRLDHDIDTVAPIQNYFSNLFPELDTATCGQVWVFDRNGTEITTLDFELPSRGVRQIRISDLISREYEYGTFMWHIRIPDSIANLEVVRNNLIYFTDRGYICYEKSYSQPVFVHGVDLYAVFQEQSMQSKELLNEHPEKNCTWTPEFPVQIGMQSDIDVMLMNRTKSTCECSIMLFSNGGDKLFEATQIIRPRGGIIQRLNSEVLQQLENSSGYLKVSGLPTQWGRPAIMRHFGCGAISAMHC